VTEEMHNSRIAKSAQADILMR